ncbi:hypothetical protein JZ751_026398 [Albula glossodonta]|uniref:Uncharacterized protein n=1 Tax=Albula glossodonta TaxID=121402 RepID=A0A8T2PBZ7_9TELE|nr:hypothetical protein JZ751_026398 [Albula glossodonta]
MDSWPTGSLAWGGELQEVWDLGKHTHLKGEDTALSPRRAYTGHMDHPGNMDLSASPVQVALLHIGKIERRTMEVVSRQPGGCVSED